MSDIIRIGQELEVLLVDASTGFLLPSAPTILADPRMTRGGKLLAKDEAAREQLELISHPATTIDSLAEDLLEKILVTEEVARTYGVTLVPGSVVGVHEITRTCGPGEDRLTTYDELMQDPEQTDRLGKICGLHTHISRIPGKETEQYNFMLGLDPLFAFSSTTPVDDYGQNSVNNSRVRRVRYDIGRNAEGTFLDGILPQYISDLQELEFRDRTRLKSWEEILLKNDGTMKLFYERCREDNTGYHPLRSRPHLAPYGTYEARSADAVPLDVTLGIAAAYFGANKRLLEDIPLEIATENDHYFFGDNRVILPSFNTLRELEQEAINKGLRSEKVHDYLRAILHFSEPGLDQIDRQYLEPLQRMLDSKQNYANQIMNFLRGELGYQEGTVNPEMGAAVHLFLADKFQESYRH